MIHNLAFVLKNTVDASPDRLAIKDHARSLNYRELWLEVQTAIRILDRIKTPERGRVGLFLPNCIEFSTFYFATLTAGRVVMPMNPMMRSQEFSYQILDAEIGHLVTTASLIPVVMQAIQEEPKLRSVLQGVIVVDNSQESFSHELRQEWPYQDISLVLLSQEVCHMATSHFQHPFPTNPHDTAVILYTSGTTGRPKGAELTHFNLISNVETLRPFQQILADQPWNALLVLPLFHSFGQTVIQNTTFALGGTIFLLERFDPWQAAQWIQKNTVTVFAGVPTMYYGILHHPSIVPSMLKSLKLCVCGGAPMPEEVMLRFNEKFKTEIIEAYGLSETAPVASMNPPFGLKKAGSIGVPIENVEFKLIGENGQLITASGVPGELYIKGPNVMKGYYKRPVETDEVLKDGWFRTGDIAQRDSDGYYHLVDRAKDLIIRGGFNVYPREIEERLYRHPDVIEAAVVGVADERLGEEVCGVVSLRPGAKTTETDLIEYCKTHLAAYKYPRKMKIVETLPKGPTGKILKREIRSTIKLHQ